MSKLLGAPFGLSLSTHDVDTFLYDKMEKKLNHWSSQKINPTGRAVIVNSVPLSTLFFFFSIWGGKSGGIKKFKSLLMYHLAAGSVQRSRIKVGWLQCCQTRENGGLNLINPEDAATTLMTKWIIKALEPDESNLHQLLRFRLDNYQPYPRGKWRHSLEFFTLDKHQAHCGSIVWNRVSTTWKLMQQEIEYVRPQNIDELLNCSLWHCLLLSLIGLSFPKRGQHSCIEMG